MSIQTLIQAADQARATFDHETAVSHYSQALKEADLPAETRYQLLDGRSACFGQMGNLQAQAVDLAQMAELAGQMGDVARQIEVINRQVNVITQVGNFDGARQAGETAVALARQHNLPNLEADSLDGVGMTYLRQAQYGLAQECFETALQLYRHIQDLTGEATSLLRLSDVSRLTGKTAEVQEYLQNALTIYRRLGDRTGEARTLNGLGVTSSDYAQKRSFYERALTIFQAVGNRERQLALYNNLGLVYLKLGLYGQASRYGEEALRIGREMKALTALAACLDGVGRAYLGLGNLQRARQLFNEGLNLSQSIKSRQLEGYYWFGLGRVAFAEQDWQAARALLETAETHFGELGNVAEQATTRAWLGAAWMEIDDWGEAHRHTAQALEQLTTIKNVSTEYPPQDVWWQHYRVLRHQLENPIGTAQDEHLAWECLDKARELMLAGIATLSDEGLRRNYLNKVHINREIVMEWAREANQRQIPLTSLTQTERAGNVRDQLQRMLDIGLRLNTQRDANTLPYFIMDEVVELSGAERAFLMFTGNGQESESLLMVGTKSQEESATIQQRANPILERVSRSWQAVLQQDEPNGHLPHDDVPELHLRSVLGIPLVSLSNLVGMIYADMRLINGRFVQADVDLLTVLANQAATAIENARLYEEILQANRQLEQRVEQRTAELQQANSSLHQRVAELDTLAAVSRDILATLDLAIVLERIAQNARELLTADTSAVYLLDEREQSLRPIAATGQIAEAIKLFRFRLGEGIVGSVAQSGTADRINDVTKDPRTIHIEGTAPTEAGEKIMVAPLLIREQVIGAMAVWRSPQKSVFSEADLNFLVALSRQVAIAIENARLFADVSDAREEAEKARLSAEDASKAKTAFLANMSHEIRTPLNAILGFTRIVKRKAQGVLPDKQVENLDKVLVSGEHLLNLINTILDIAKIEARRMDVHASEFNVTNLVEVCAITIQPLIKTGVMLEKEIEANLPLMHSDQDKIKQILINLLSNAAKFTHQGKITVQAYQEGSHVALAVKDSGIGISTEALPRVFEEFQQAESTTRRDYGGTGLGLPISRTLARLLGGDLTAASVIGEGSTFTLSVPIRYEGE